MTKQTVHDIDVDGKLIVVRVDYNVPVKDGLVGDTLRIEASFDTLRYLLNHNCRLVLLAHLGEPKGAVDSALSLRPVAAKAAELLGTPITFYDDCIGSSIEEAAHGLKAGEIMMCENVRFHQEELDCDPAFTASLARLGEIYVNDAFAVDHRRQASVSEVSGLIPGVAGLLVEKEVNYITGALDHPNRPLVAVAGGAKVSSKLATLKFLIPKVDVLVLGGAMANTFFVADGHNVGKSLAEPELAKEVKALRELAEQENTELILPDEVVVSRNIDQADNVRTVGVDGVHDDEYIVDVTERLAGRMEAAIYEFLDFDNSCTVIWNGPLGHDEISEFAHGSEAMALAVTGLKNAITIIGGGDTAAFVDEHGMHDKFTWVSTGGGASLELMSGQKLPGVEALLDKK